MMADSLDDILGIYERPNTFGSTIWEVRRAHGKTRYGGERTGFMWRYPDSDDFERKRKNKSKYNRWHTIWAYGKPQEEAVAEAIEAKLDEGYRLLKSEAQEKLEHKQKLESQKTSKVAQLRAAKLLEIERRKARFVQEEAERIRQEEQNRKLEDERLQRSKNSKAMAALLRKL
jgi:hypothetical protein